MNDLASFFGEASATVDTEIARLIGEAGMGSERLRDAMEWSLFGGGKRFRPALVFAVGDAIGVDREKLLTTAAAVEMIHTYSLIHDDLPAMDNDDLRRGRETCHRKFDEATAILAGDALHVLAFEAIANDQRLPVDVRLELITGLSEAAKKMVIGQQMDLDAEGRESGIDQIQEIHANKTGALIRFSASAAAVIGSASGQVRSSITDYGTRLGLLFQISDDILDVTQSTETLGKTASKDVAAQKATYPAVIGIERSMEYLKQIHESTLAALDATSRPELLSRIADYVVGRDS